MDLSDPCWWTVKGLDFSWQLFALKSCHSLSTLPCKARTSGGDLKMGWTVRWQKQPQSTIKACWLVQNRKDSTIFRLPRNKYRHNGDMTPWKKIYQPAESIGDAKTSYRSCCRLPTQTLYSKKRTTKSSVKQSGRIFPMDVTPWNHLSTSFMRDICGAGKKAVNFGCDDCRSWLA